MSISAECPIETIGICIINKFILFHVCSLNVGIYYILNYIL